MTGGPGGSGSLEPQPFLNRQTLTFIAFVLCPVLGLVCAVMGLVLVVQGQVVAGVVFLVVLTQAFVALGLWAYARRRALLTSDAPQDRDGSRDSH